MTPRKPAKKAGSPEEEDFRRRWAVRRFPNTNIARDLEPHELARMREEAARLGITL